jgi:DNA-binding NarL/FixJ family response regulator
VKVFILDPHSIYRRGLAASLSGLDEVESVGEAESVKDAWQTPALLETDLVLVDHEVLGASEFIGQVRESIGARVLVCTSSSDEELVLTSMHAGAAGLLSKDTLTPDTLAAGVRAAASGAGVLAPDVLSALLGAAGRRGPDERVTERATLHSRLTEREQQVLTLIADGHPTREVAEQLCYSERTVKNVLHDVTTKLNARSRSQAVAFAVREGLI